MFCIFNLTHIFILLVVTESVAWKLTHCILPMHSAISSRAISQKPGKSLLPTRCTDQRLKIIFTSTTQIPFWYIKLFKI